MIKNHSHATSVSDATQLLENFIISGKCRPGDRLPSEPVLAAMLNVKRSTLRESLKELEKSGLLKTVRGPKGGRFLSDSTTKVAGDMFRLLFQLKKVTLAELIEARIITESATAALAAERRSEEMLLRMKQMLIVMEQNINNKSIFMDINYDLHHLIAQESGNIVLAITLQALREAIFKFFEPIPISDEIFYIGLEQHKKISTAIETKNSELARSLMVEHIKDFQLKTTKHF
ncbi:MAG: FadR family transcriptional regulator [Clostridia bacterium]|nr:FadR family transcriptional regulator [Clostridia bacterium]